MSDTNSNIIKEKRGSASFNKDKKSDKSPDIIGNFVLDNKKWKISMWKNVTKDGKEFLSISISEPPPENADYKAATPNGQSIQKPEPVPGAIVDLSSDDLSDLDSILGLAGDDEDSPFNS